MTCAMNAVEASIVGILEAAAYKGIFFPREILNAIEDCIYKCQYKNALWKITKYLDPFRDSFDMSLLVASWEITSQYTRQLYDTLMREHLKEVHGGYRSVRLAPLDILQYMRDAARSLKSCEKGTLKAKHMHEYRQKGCVRVASGIEQAMMFKSKCN
jgi:hypothetical protein